MNLKEHLDLSVFFFIPLKKFKILDPLINIGFQRYSIILREFGIYYHHYNKFGLL